MTYHGALMALDKGKDAGAKMCVCTCVCVCLRAYTWCAPYTGGINTFTHIIFPASWCLPPFSSQISSHSSVSPVSAGTTLLKEVEGLSMFLPSQALRSASSHLPASGLLESSGMTSKGFPGCLSKLISIQLCLFFCLPQLLIEASGSVLATLISPGLRAHFHWSLGC